MLLVTIEPSVIRRGPHLRRTGTFARQLYGSHEDLSIKSNLKYKVSAYIVIPWRRSLLECFIEVKPSALHVLNDNLRQCKRNVFPYFTSSLINACSVSLMVSKWSLPNVEHISGVPKAVNEEKKPKRKLSAIRGNTRRRGQGIGKLASRGERMMRKVWFVIAIGASRTNQLWSHRMC